MSEPVTLTFNLSLYALDAIAETVGAYDQLAGFVVEESPEQVRVVLTDLHPDVPDLPDHFANHVLWATITQQRRSEEAAQ